MTAAAVVLRVDPADLTGARLDAYVVLRDGSGDSEQARRHAARFLPDYMVPATVTALPALPLTPNGKVDHARLPDPLGMRPRAQPASDRPADNLADAVRSAWEAVFGIQVEMDDDFFAMGGNSLLAVRLSAALQAAGLPAVTVPQLYRSRTVNGLATFFCAADRERS